jgi:hypothetical protein
MKTTFSHAAAFGAAAGITTIILALLIYVADLPEGLNNLSYVVLIAFHCIGVKKWREQQGGFLTYGGAYKHLLVQSAVFTVLMAIWMFIFTSYVAPGFFESKIAEVEMKMEEQGQSPQAIEMAMKWTRWMFKPEIMVGFALLGIIFYGLIDLIIAAIMKKDPPAQQFNDYPPVPNMGNQEVGQNPNQQHGGSPYQTPTNPPPQP